MKFCNPHWEELREAIKSKGMWDLVSRNGEEAVKRLSDEDKKPESFDPLMSAHNMILGNALKAGGLYLLQGDYCPLCELDKNNDKMGEHSKDWIEGATNGCLEHCRELGLVKVQ